MHLTLSASVAQFFTITTDYCFYVYSKESTADRRLTLIVVHILNNFYSPVQQFKIHQDCLLEYWYNIYQT